ncbi:DNA-binding protein [Arthrobacter sp. JZ12]|uniref:integration host factor, actinobacterial type n=1 Tax=Arthrobacter sp. JZ12 TaxID=2654190 RepID=UPI002B48F895|nr:integration host factor, actinobacterial type [Arthrobacter sp. JZ12]WRH25022.1 DNA-binding protein [Arthrobacter sp. JZ12]
MSLKPLTDSERTLAREKATAARAARAELKSRLKSGQLTVGEVINGSPHEDAIGRLRVLDLLKALPGVGEKRAAGIMEAVGIAPTRRVRGLGVHQRKALVEHLMHHQASNRH